MRGTLAQPDYESLADLRYQIRRFLHFSEQAARAAGLEPQQHQLMLALKGLPAGARPLVGELAERLQLRHHSTVELVNRLAAKGLIRRVRDSNDRREVTLALTPRGEKMLRELSLHHKAELGMRGAVLLAALRRAMQLGKSRDAKSAGRKRGSRQKNGRTTSRKQDGGIA